MSNYNGDVHRYIAFESGVNHDLQQNDSRLLKICKEVMNSGKQTMHDFLGEVGNFDPITERHANTKLTEADHKRRTIICKPFAKAFLIDDEDVARQAHNIGSMYVEATAKSYRRSVDAIIFEALNAQVLTGESGTVLTSRGTTNDIGAQGQYNATTEVWEPAGAAADTGLTIDKLRRAKNRLDVEYANELGKYYFICHPDHIAQLLGSVEATSADYNSVRALVNGELNTFMGFEFIQYNEVDVAAGIYDCYAVAAGSMYFAKQTQTGSLRTTKRVRADKNDAQQILSKCDHGASRMYDEGVLQVKCKA